MATATGTLTAKGIAYPIPSIRQACEALDRAWQNATISESARKDIELALKVLQSGELLMEPGPIRLNESNEVPS